MISKGQSILKKTEAALTKVHKEKDQLTKDKQAVDVELHACFSHFPYYNFRKLSVK